MQENSIEIEAFNCITNRKEKLKTAIAKNEEKKMCLNKKVLKILKSNDLTKNTFFKKIRSDNKIKKIGRKSFVKDSFIYEDIFKKVEKLKNKGKVDEANEVMSRFEIAKWTENELNEMDIRKDFDSKPINTVLYKKNEKEVSLQRHFSFNLFYDEGLKFGNLGVIETININSRPFPKKLFAWLVWNSNLNNKRYAKNADDEFRADNTGEAVFSSFTILDILNDFGLRQTIESRKKVLQDLIILKNCKLTEKNRANEITYDLFIVYAKLTKQKNKNFKRRKERFFYAINFAKTSDAKMPEYQVLNKEIFKIKNEELFILGLISVSKCNMNGEFIFDLRDSTMHLKTQKRAFISKQMGAFTKAMSSMGYEVSYCERTQEYRVSKRVKKSGI